MHRLFAFFALLPICISAHGYFQVPEPYNFDNDESSPYIYAIGSFTIFAWYSDHDSVELYLYHDEENYSNLTKVDGSGGWYYPWNVSIPDTISEDISTFRLLIQDSDTGDHLAWSRRLSILSPGELESAVPSITSSYFLGTLTVDWLTTISTASAESSPSGQSKSEAVPSKDSEKDSSSKSWVGPVAGLGGLWALTLLSLAGFCFYRHLKRRVKQQHEVPAISSNLVPYHTENTEPSPPFTSEMATTRPAPDFKPPITARESLTALPSTEGRSTTHNSLVSELAG